MKKRRNILSAREQLKRIKHGFPNAIIEEKGKKSFSVILKLKPSSITKTYDVRIFFKYPHRLSVYVINEKLKVAHNRKKLPHVFSHENQKLCLYQFDENKWTSSQSISSTIIPWASEWLYYYEFWLIDGKWSGGGHDEYSNNEIAKEHD